MTVASCSPSASPPAIPTTAGPFHAWSVGSLARLFGDKGYISAPLAEQLFLEQGLRLITKLRKNMRNILLPLADQLLLRKRALIETIIDQLKNVCQIEHSRHRSPFNFLRPSARWPRCLLPPAQEALARPGSPSAHCRLSYPELTLLRRE